MVLVFVPCFELNHLSSKSAKSQFFDFLFYDCLSDRTAPPRLASSSACSLPLILVWPETQIRAMEKNSTNSDMLFQTFQTLYHFSVWWKLCIIPDRFSAVEEPEGVKLTGFAVEDMKVRRIREKDLADTNDADSIGHVSVIVDGGWGKRRLSHCYYLPTGKYNLLPLFPY